jgi:hypothetical protein
MMRFGIIQEWFGAFVDVMEAHREPLFAGPLLAQTNAGGGLVPEKVWCFVFSDLIVLATHTGTEQKLSSGTPAVKQSMTLEGLDFIYVDHLRIDEFMLTRAVLNSLLEEDSLAVFRLLNDGKVFTLYSADGASRDAWVATVVGLTAAASAAVAAAASVSTDAAAGDSDGCSGSSSVGSGGDSNGSSDSSSGGRSLRRDSSSAKTVGSQAGGSRTSAGRQSTIHRPSFSVVVTLPEYHATLLEVDITAVHWISAERVAELRRDEGAGGMSWMTGVLKAAEAETAGGVAGVKLGAGGGGAGSPRKRASLIKRASMTKRGSVTKRGSITNAVAKRASITGASIKRGSITGGVKRGSVASRGSVSAKRWSIGSDSGKSSGGTSSTSGGGRSSLVNYLISGSSDGNGGSSGSGGSGGGRGAADVEYTIQLTMHTRGITWAVAKTFAQVELLRSRLVDCFPRNGHNVPKLPRVKAMGNMRFGRQTAAGLRKQAAGLSHFMQVGGG